MQKHENRNNTPRSAPAMINANRLTEQTSYDTHNAGSPSLAPASSEVPSSLTRAAQSYRTSSIDPAPTTRTFFDPWNSSSTGHQRAENRLSGSTSWRVSRNLKLGEQYKGGLNGGKRVADTVGAGSEDFGKDGRNANGGWEKGAKGLRKGGQKSLVDVWGASKVGKKPSQEKVIEADDICSEDASTYMDGDQDHDQDLNPDVSHNVSKPSPKPLEKQIFAGLCFYTNGSTAPLVSDHKLKQLLALYGARHSIALGRRSVTHVILGTANAHGGAGGGLAASKIQKEIARTGGKAVKFITAEWVLESIKANRRLPESRFSPLKLAPKTQNSVFGMLRASSAAKS